MNSIEFPEMNYKHFREKNAKFRIFLLLSIMGGISLITIYDRKFRHNRPEEGLPKMITYISPINMVAEDNHLYFAYKSPLGCYSLPNSLCECFECFFLPSFDVVYLFLNMRHIKFYSEGIPFVCLFCLHASKYFRVHELFTYLVHCLCIGPLIC